MKSITATWFECKIKYDKVQEDGSTKPTPEVYVVDALSFTEAEKKIIEEASLFVSGAFEVVDIKKKNYHEVMFDDEHNDADKWFLAKVAFITMDEKTGKKKKTPVQYLVNASSFPNAVANVQKVMGSGMSDYEIVSVSDANVFEVVEHKVGTPVGPDAKPEYEQ